MDRSPRATVQIGPIAAIAAFAVARGIEIERIREVTGLTITDLVQPEARADDEVVGALWQLLHETFPDEAIGVQMAAAAPFSFFGVLGHAASYAEDLRGALEIFIRYRQVLATELELTLEEGPSCAWLRMSHPLDRSAPSPAPEAAFGVTARFIREILAVEDAIVRVEFTHEPAGPRSVYREFFRCELCFGRAHNALVLRTAALDRPTRQGDRHRAAALQEHLAGVHRELAGGDAREAIVRIRAAIAANARRSEYGAEALARRLGMSLRSLQRLARGHGASVRRLLDEAREAHARRLLDDPHLSVDEVAFLLGYSAESAFRRAYKRWAGVSPAAYRRGPGARR